MANIREVIEICLEEKPMKELNRFIGFRELEVKVAWVTNMPLFQEKIPVHKNEDLPKGLLRKIVREDLKMEMEEFEK